MMARYVMRVRQAFASYDDDAPLLPHVSVEETVPTFTGLLDASGDEIWRTPNPIGFGRDEDW